MIFGITGGTGCGKTTLLQAMELAGVLVLDCDAVYHALLQKDANLLSAIENRFPGTVENGQLQRKKLGGIVFSDPSALEDLNHITHNAVKAEVVHRLQEHRGHAAIDAIGLFEGGLAELCDVTVAITASREDRIQRLMLRDNITQEYAASRIDAQKPESWFREHCDHTLVNNGSFQDFQSKCLAFLREMNII